jgi:hypothetical protein
MQRQPYLLPAGFFALGLGIRKYAYVAQAAKPADEAKPRLIRKKTNTRQRMTSKAGLAAWATCGLTQGQTLQNPVILHNLLVYKKLHTFFIKFKSVNYFFLEPVPVCLSLFAPVCPASILTVCTSVAFPVFPGAVTQM